MLQNIRNNVQGTMAKVIVALIAVPFALFGIDAFFTGGGASDVAVVNGVEITESELAQSVEMQRRRLLGQAQGQIDAAALDEAALRAPVLDSLIDRLLIQQVADKAGFRVSEGMLNQTILEDENFQDNGTFSQARFQGLIGSSGMTPAYYKSLLREEILMTQVMSGLAASEFITERELREVARITQQSMDVAWVRFALPQDLSAFEVPAERISAYYEDNKQEFRSEETVVVEYLEMKLEDLYQPVEEAELRAEYERRMADFAGGAERRAAHIMLSSLSDEEARAELQALREQILGGADFAQLAQEKSEDIGTSANGGDLGFSSGDSFPESFEAALLTLEPGGVSEPIQSDSGWHLLTLTEVRVQQPPSFEEQRAQIEAQLQRAAAEPLFVQRSEQMADLSFNSDGLKEAAEALGLTIARSEAFSRRGGDGVFADARVIGAAFGKDVLENKQNSELLELDAEHVVVLHLARHEAERQQELAEVEERIRDLLRESLAREAVRSEADALLAALREGQDLQTLAEAGDHEVQTVTQHFRGGEGLDEELSEAVFSTARPDSGSGSGVVTLANGDAAVFRTSNFLEGEYARVPPEQQLALRNLLQQARGREIVAHYQKRLRETASIERL